MKKNVLFMVIAIFALSINTKANDDHAYHSFLKPEYKGVFTQEKIGTFIEILKGAAVGKPDAVAYFQDPKITQRLAAHFEKVLEANYPGDPVAVITSLEWIPAQDFTGNLEMGMLTLDYEQTVFESNWSPRPGEMLGMYGDIPVISSYCGNFTKGKYIAAQQPAVNTPTEQPATTVKTQLTQPASNNQQVTISQGQSVMEFYSSYALGQRDMAAIEDHDMLKMQQMKSILGSDNTTSTSTSTIGASNVVYQQTPSQQDYYPQQSYQQPSYGYGYGMSQSQIIIDPRINIGGGRQQQTYQSRDYYPRTGGNYRSGGRGTVVQQPQPRQFNQTLVGPPQTTTAPVILRGNTSTLNPIIAGSSRNGSSRSFNTHGL